MDAAEKIMKKKGFIREELVKEVPGEEGDKLWQRATETLREILHRYESLPKGVHTHTDAFIFPAAAIYLTAKGKIGEERAFRVIEDSAIKSTAAMGEKLSRMMRLPGMSSFFLALWDPISKHMFGEKNGFQNRFYPKEKGAYRMDILSCPYQTYFTQLGCPELTRIFCENDDRTYGNLPGLAFERNSTLGKGGKRCDFYLRKV